MEATKALAQKLLIRSRPSLRRKFSKRNSQTPAEDNSPKVARETNRQSKVFKQQDVAAAKPSSEIPVPVAIPDPPAAADPAASAAPPTNEVSSASNKVVTGAPLEPSPGSDVSPRTTDRIDPEKVPVETPTSDYFSLNNDDTVEDTTPGKISFVIPSKADTDTTLEPGTEQASLPETENPVSSTTPSTVVSPRDSVDEKLSSTLDDRRSSIVSSASQRSSTGSVARRFSTGLALQGRSWFSKDFVHQELTPTLSST